MQIVGLGMVLLALACIWLLRIARNPDKQFRRPIWPLLLFLPIAIAMGLVFAFGVLHGFNGSDYKLSAALIPILVTLFFLIYVLVFGGADILYRAFTGKWMHPFIAMFLAASIVFARFVVPTGWFGVAEGTSASTKAALMLPLPVDLVTAIGTFAVVAALIYTLRAVTQERV